MKRKRLFSLHQNRELESTMTEPEFTLHHVWKTHESFLFYAKKFEELVKLQTQCRIWPLISESACKTLICSRVTSGLDFWTAFLYCIHLSSLTRLQRIQNTATRITIVTYIKMTIQSKCYSIYVGAWSNMPFALGDFCISLVAKSWYWSKSLTSVYDTKTSREI